MSHGHDDDDIARRARVADARRRAVLGGCLVGCLGGCLVARPSFARAQSGCMATDYAPESIAVLVRPGGGAATAASHAPPPARTRALPRDSVAALVLVDAVGGPAGDWLQVRGAAVGWVSARDVACRLAPEAARAAVAPRAAAVMAALRATDVAKLARHVHPTKGLRLSPYATVDEASDVVLPAARLTAAWRSRARRVWGTEDGSARPLNLTFREYYRRFVYDRDFAAAQPAFNADDDGTRRAWAAYPSAIVGTYHVPATTRAAASLRLVFERHHGRWYLVGLVHDGYTI